MAVSSLKEQFERLSIAVEPEVSPLSGKSQTPGTKLEPEKKNKEKSSEVKNKEGKQSPKKLPKSALKQIGKSISNSSPSEIRKSKPIKSASTEESAILHSDRNSDPMVTLAGIIKKSPSPKHSQPSHSPCSSGTNSPLTQSGAYDPSHALTNNNSGHLLSSSGDHVHIEFSDEHGQPLQQDDSPKCSPEGTPLRNRSSSYKEREAKSRSSPLPLVPAKPKSHLLSSSPNASTSPKTKPKPFVRPKPSVSPKPAIPPKPKLSVKPNLLPHEVKTVEVVKTQLPEKQALPNETIVTSVLTQEPSDIHNTLNGIPNTSTLDIKTSTKTTDTVSEVDKDNIQNRIEEVIQFKDFELADPLKNASSDPFSPILPNECEVEVQSADNATLTIVGDCKRNTTDSGFLEEGTEEEDRNKEVNVWDTAKRDKARKKRHNIALELLETEKTYVNRIKIIAEDFRQAIQAVNAKSNKPIIPEATICLIFLNIGEIYNLNRQLLQDLEERMNNWSTNEQIGDVMSSIAPFLKLYSMYTAGFEDAMKILTETMAKEKKLDTAVKEFEKQLGTGLGVAHYMLEPVQRIPRYKLLLQDYLKNLPEDSPERPAATKALDIIGEAADKTNNRIKELENSNEILAIQRTIVDYEGTLLQAHRRFIKKGLLQKLSRKTQAPRMFFLFSDILLHTEPTGPSTYKFKNELTLYSVKVELPKVSLVPHAFEIFSTNRSFILSASSDEERMDWVTALQGAINDDKEKRKSLKRDRTQLFTLDRSGFGTAAPILVPDQSVSMCQLCSKEFTFTFRRHHCRACGRVVCGNCSPFKAYLAYMKKEERICAECDNKRRQVTGDEIDGDFSPIREQPINRPQVPSVLILDPNEREKDVIMEGYVHEQDGKKWNRCWYVIKNDLALYKFKAHEDIRAIETVPLPGYRVTTDKVAMTVNLIHHQAKKKKLNLSFKTDSMEEFDIWVDVIEKASRLEVADIAINSENMTLLSPTKRVRSHSLHDLVESNSANNLTTTPEADRTRCHSLRVDGDSSSNELTESV